MSSNYTRKTDFSNSELMRYAHDILNVTDYDRTHENSKLLIGIEHALKIAKKTHKTPVISETMIHELMALNNNLFNVYISQKKASNKCLCKKLLNLINKEYFKI